MPDTIAPRARVLVVDDEPTVRLVARMMLERAGLSADEVATGAAALEHLRGAVRPYLAVLLDVTLPDCTGPELVPHMRELAPDTPIVISSGRCEEDVPDHGADAFLAKPFTRDRLLAALREAAGARV